MKNETLKRDLASRMFEGVRFDGKRKGWVSFDGNIKVLCPIDFDGRWEEIKPYLFHTSALTKPIQLANYNNGEPFVPVEEIGKIHLGDKYHSFDFPKEDENFIGFNSKYGGWSMYNFGDFSSLPQWIIELLNRWHINYRLSPDQFIEVTEEFNPYK